MKSIVAKRYYFLKREIQELEHVIKLLYDCCDIGLNHSSIKILQHEIDVIMLELDTL